MSTQYEVNGCRIEADRIYVRDYVEGFNPHRVRPWILGNEYGALAVVWAECEQDAFDAACNADLLAGLALDDDYVAELEREYGIDGAEELFMRLGNAGEPHDSEYAWIAEAKLSPQLLALCAACHEAGQDVVGNAWTGPAIAQATRPQA